MSWWEMITFSEQLVALSGVHAVWASVFYACCTIVVTLYVMLKSDGKLHVFAFMEGLPRYKYISIGFYPNHTGYKE